MEISRLTTLLSVLVLTACHGAGQPSALAAKNDVPEEWKFNFFTPRALPALVTFVVILDEEDMLYRFKTIDSTKALYDVVGEWNDRSRAPGGHWNKIKSPPRHMFFCWDSIIDKKVYETEITFSQADRDKMRNPSGQNDPYNNTYDTVLIGLAPEGKVAVWIRGIGFEPNQRVTPVFLETVSGDKLDICKGVTRFSNGYEYGKNTEDFIKEKTYPYGNW